MDTSTETGLGARLRAAREAMGWSAAQLAREAGVDSGSQAVRCWERGAYLPSAKCLPGLARALGVTTDWLLTGEEGGDNG